MTEEEVFLHKDHMPKEVEIEIDRLDLYDNNTSGRNAELRDTYLEAEREYVLELLKSEEIRKLIKEYNFEDSDKLFEAAQKIMFEVENNLIPYDKMEQIEQVLTILLASIKDKVLVKKLELYRDFSEEKEQGGRSR